MAASNSSQGQMISTDNATVVKKLAKILAQDSVDPLCITPKDLMSCSKHFRSEWFSGEGNHQFGLKGMLNGSHISDIRTSSYGYLLVRNTTHPFKMYNDLCFLHRLVYEEGLRENFPDSPCLVSVEGWEGKWLDPEVVIHHIDENKANCHISNLKSDNCSGHTTHHNIHRTHIRDEETGRFIKIQGLKGREGNLVKKNFQDAGLDIKSSESKTIPAGESQVFATGIFAAVPDNHVGLIWSRSGLSVKNKIEVGAGCIDASYRGEIVIHLYNHGKSDYKVEVGDRIAQMLTIPVNLEEYKVQETSTTDRGDRGLGHTGK